MISTHTQITVKVAFLSSEPHTCTKDLYTSCVFIGLQEAKFCLLQVNCEIQTRHRETDIYKITHKIMGVNESLMKKTLDPFLLPAQALTFKSSFYFIVGL